MSTELAFVILYACTSPTSDGMISYRSYEVFLNNRPAVEKVLSRPLCSEGQTLDSAILYRLSEPRAITPHRPEIPVPIYKVEGWE